MNYKNAIQATGEGFDTTDSGRSFEAHSTETTSMRSSNQLSISSTGPAHQTSTQKM